MRFKYQARALCALAALGIGMPAAAQQLTPSIAAPSAETGVPAFEGRQLWFVELEGAPMADGGNLSRNQSEKNAFRKNAERAGVKFSERYAYDKLFNGLSIRVAKSDVSKLSRIPGVKAIYPVGITRVPETRSVSEPELATALAMTGADLAQSALGLTGAGVKVAVMDTGIDYHHPDLGGCFGPSCRVTVGHDFVGNAYNADLGTAPAPDSDPDDCHGHGTHVAGIVGASGTVKGVAPGVTFGAYKVFGCDGTTDDDIMVAAMERVLADGMQILNMSIGSAFQWPQYPTGMAANRLVNSGVSVVASIGNSGANGLYSASAPGLGAKVIGVASFDNTHSQLPFFTITPDAKPIAYFAGDGPTPPTSGTDLMKRTGTAASGTDACNAVAPAPGSLAGFVALIRRGGCTFYEKARNAQLAGASAVVIYNNAAGFISPSVLPPTPTSPTVDIPTVGITAADGGTIDTRLSGGPVTMTWTNGTMAVANATGGLISSFSSYGLSPDLALKPDIGAPGGFIYSTYPLEKGAYATLSGTSMASPHVAGGVALLMQAKPHTSPQAVGGILQNTAAPKVWSLNPATGLLDHVHRQGAGMVQIDDAILSTVKVSPSKISMGESEAGGSTHAITVRNEGAADVTFNLSRVNAVSTGPNTFALTFNASNAAVAFDVPSLTVPAGGTATFTATITPSSGPAGGMYSGYIVLTPVDGGQVYRVPFGGFMGDYQSKVVLVPTAAGFPWLLDQTLSGPLPSGGTFTMVGDDVAYFGIHFDHQSRTVKMEISDATTGKSWHTAFKTDYFGRNSTSTGAFLFSWDGVTTAGNKEFIVPNGQYVAKLSVLKAGGDAANPAHWETWNSPVITIARP